MSLTDKQMAQWAEHLTLVGTDREMDLGASWLRLKAKNSTLESQLLDAKRNEERAVAEVGELQARVAELEEVEFLGVLQIGSDNRNGEHVLVWHDGVWKCACYEDAVGVWVGWYVVGGQGTRPLDPEPVHYRPLPPDLDGKS